MRIGVPREIKSDEFRVALLPVGAELLTRDGHEVWVEKDAGLAVGFDDAAYERAGAHIAASAGELFETGELLVKVKEPQPSEIARLTAQHTVFGYFHFAASAPLTEACLAQGFAAVAYETLEDATGGLPLLTPMSEVAGRLAIQSGAKHLEQPQGGSGVLLGGVPGVLPANVVILGGGVVGKNAALIAAGFGANVRILDVNVGTLRTLDAELPANVSTLYSDPHAIADSIAQADLVVGAVLLRGRAAPKLITRDHLRMMRPGSVVVDVCIDQGGCLETSRPTTHSQPTYVEEGIVHYCVANMPAAVGKTSTHALCNATLPYVRQLAKAGTEAFLSADAGRRRALNMSAGKVRNGDVAAAFPDLPFEA